MCWFDLVCHARSPFTIPASGDSRKRRSDLHCLGRGASWRLARTGPLALINEGMMLSWIQGFLTGLSLMALDQRSSVQPLPDADALRELIDRHCQARSADNLISVGLKIYGDLRRRGER